MNPQTVFCPNPACPATGRIGVGTITIHARTPPRYRCTVCAKTFSPRVGTPFYRRPTAEAIIIQVITLIAHGCPIPAIVAAFGVQRQTVMAWLDAAGTHCEAIHRHLVCQPRDLGAVQADEIRVRQQGGIVWVALATAGGDPALARRSGQSLAGWHPDRSVVRAGQGVCAARAAARVCRWVRGVRETGTAYGTLAGTACRQAGALSARGMAGIGDRTGRQTAQGAISCGGNAAIGAWKHGVGDTAARRRHDPDGVHRATERNVPGTTGSVGTTDACGGTDDGTIGAWDVAGRRGVQLSSSVGPPILRGGRAWRRD